MAIAARMPMIATTIINSISVKPFCIRFCIEILLSTKSWAIRRLGETESKGHANAGLLQVYEMADVLNVLCPLSKDAGRVWTISDVNCQSWRWRVPCQT